MELTVRNDVNEQSIVAVIAIARPQLGQRRPAGHRLVDADLLREIVKLGTVHVLPITRRQRRQLRPVVHQLLHLLLALRLAQRNQPLIETHVAALEHGNCSSARSVVDQVHVDGHCVGKVLSVAGCYVDLTPAAAQVREVAR